MAFYLANLLQILPGKSSGVLYGIHSDPTGEKLDLLKICRVWVSCRDHRFFLPVCWFSPIEWKSNMTYIAYIFMFGTGLEPGQVAGTLDMRSCAPSIST